MKVVKPPITGTGSGRTADCYEFGAFRLDCRTRELRRGDELVPLTLKAFELLRVLVSAGGTVLEKSELMKLVWPDSFVTEDSLTHNIATLRRALGDTSERPQYILTVPRYGYRFLAPVRVLPNEGPVETTHEEPTPPSASAREQTPADPSNESVHARLVPASGYRLAEQWSRPLASLTLALITAIALAVWLFRPTSSTTPLPTTFTVHAPEGTTFSRSASFLAVSPNGRLLAFLAGRPGADMRVYVRSLESLTARELPGTDGALGPFWSPDSQTLGFFADGYLKTVSLHGEPPKSLCKVTWGTPSATWNRDDVILFSHEDVIFRISAKGGGASSVTSVDPGRGESAHLLPQFLPNGRHFLFLARGAGGGAQNSWIAIGSLDESKHERLITASSQALYADPGYLLFLRDGELLAQPFDTSRNQPMGTPLSVADAEDVGFNPSTPRGMFSVSQTGGTLAYRPASIRELGWYDRAGAPLGWIGAAGRDSDPALSPDDQRVAVSRYDKATKTRNIWIIDGRTAVASPLTSHYTWAACPTWSPDGSRIAFALWTRNSGQLYEMRVSGKVEARAFGPPTAGCPVEWLPDGQLVYPKVSDAAERTTNESESAIWLHAVDAGTEPQLLTGPWSTETKRWVRVSPDHRWIAYVSDASGRNEVYVRPFRNGEARKVSQRGGIEPEWRSDGRELFFIAPDGHLIAATIDDQPPTEMPTALFKTDLDPNGFRISGRNQYAVSKSGDRLLLNQPRPGAAEPPVVVLTHWTAALRK